VRVADNDNHLFSLSWIALAIMIVRESIAVF